MDARERRESVLVGQLAADELRLARGVGNQPIGDLWPFIDAEPQLNLAFHTFENDGDGVYRWDGQHGLIVVNSAIRAFGRKRFTAAHELGHHVMHRAGGVVEIADKNVFGDDGDPRELQANAFAAHLLAPTAAMRQAFPGVPEGDISVEMIVDLMIAYGLSFQTAANRLNNVGRINGRNRQRLLVEAAGQIEGTLIARGHRGDPRRATDLPPAYTVEVLRLHRVGVIDRERLAELLGVSNEAAETFIEEVGGSQPTVAPPDLGELGAMLDDALAEQDS